VAQQHSHGVHVACRDQDFPRESAPPAVAGVLDTSTLVQAGDMALQGVAGLVVPALPSLQRTTLCILTQGSYSEQLKS